MGQSLKSLLIVALVYSCINTLCLVLTDLVVVPNHKLGHFFDPFFIITMSLPIGIVAALLWLRGIKAKSTTIRHGGFVGFYAFIISTINPSAFFVYVSSFGVALFLSVCLLSLLGFWFGRSIESAFPNIAFEKITPQEGSPSI